MATYIYNLLQSKAKYFFMHHYCYMLYETFFFLSLILKVKVNIVKYGKLYLSKVVVIYSDYLNFKIELKKNQKQFI